MLLARLCVKFEISNQSQTPPPENFLKIVWYNETNIANKSKYYLGNNQKELKTDGQVCNILSTLIDNTATTLKNSMLQDELINFMCQCKTYKEGTKENHTSQRQHFYQT